MCGNLWFSVNCWLTIGLCPLGKDYICKSHSLNVNNRQLSVAVKKNDDLKVNNLHHWFYPWIEDRPKSQFEENPNGASTIIPDHLESFRCSVGNHPNFAR